MGHVGPTLNKKNIKIKLFGLIYPRRCERDVERFVFFFLFSLASFFDIRKSNRRNSSGQEENCSTRRGLRLGTKNTRFRRVFN